MAAKGKSRGQNWSERKMQALVSIWSTDRIQWELKKSAQNDLAFAQISRELAECGYIRTVEQCRAKVKLLRVKYKQIADRLRLYRTSDHSISNECGYDYAQILLLLVIKGLQSSSHRCQPLSPSPITISSLSSPANHQETNEHNHEFRRRHLI